ncbi:MAG: DUF1697 domain-containing protein [Propionibacteriaceae bacterium]|nr:DUF1697 domain-containing protein [Propionibacteriaceae bacterium]
MTTYVALLRGVNVGGNNKISMKELGAEFESQGFANVLTYINSGNILFDSGIADVREVKAACEAVILERFGLDIAVAILAAGELVDAIAHAPNWWGRSPNAEPDAKRDVQTGVKSGAKHNAIFVISPMSAAQACASMGEPKPEVEKIAYHGCLIFWTAQLATFNQTRWAKVVNNKEVYNAITIRNANTAYKLAELAKARMCLEPEK